MENLNFVNNVPNACLFKTCFLFGRSCFLWIIQKLWVSALRLHTRYQPSCISGETLTDQRERLLSPQAHVCREPCLLWSKDGSALAAQFISFWLCGETCLFKKKIKLQKDPKTSSVIVKRVLLYLPEEFDGVGLLISMSSPLVIQKKVVNIGNKNELVSRAYQQFWRIYSLSEWTKKANCFGWAAIPKLPANLINLGQWIDFPVSFAQSQLWTSCFTGHHRSSNQPCCGQNSSGDILERWRKWQDWLL